MTSRLLLLAALTAALSGCSPCEEACRVESRQFEDCLSEWGMDWIDVGALDKIDYRKTCVAEVDVWLDGLEADARAEENRQCQGLVNDLQGQTNCDAAWQALVDYGTVE